MQPEPLVNFNWYSPSAFFRLVLTSFINPRQFFTDMPRRGGLLTPMVFFAIVQVIPFVVQLFCLWYMDMTDYSISVMLGWLYGLLQPLLIGLALMLITRWFFFSPLAYEEAVRILCYSSGIWIITAFFIVLIPLDVTIGYMALLAGRFSLSVVNLILVVIGLKQVTGMKTGQAAGAVLLTVLVVLAVLVAKYILLADPGTTDIVVP